MKRATLILAIGGFLMVPTAFAKPPFLAKAKELALPDITNCQACHISTEKGNVKFNERGLWLKAKKQELNAETVDVTWLKDYKPAS
jgi:mono/diheme cytochrome c family protein